MITKNIMKDGWRQMMDGTIGTIPEPEESRYYDAEEYALPGLGYIEKEPLCHCDKCEKRRQTLSKIVGQDVR